jgi:outer membrane murein-binding lipoprotein Lpp
MRSCEFVSRKGVLMRMKLVVFASILGLIFVSGSNCFAQEGGASEKVVNELKQEIERLRARMEAEKKAYEERLNKMQEKIDAVSGQMLEKAATGAEEDLEAEIVKSQAEIPSVPSKGIWSGIQGGIQSLNPDISVTVDTFYHNSDATHGLGEVAEEMAGFGHSHDPGQGHEHAALEEGYNLRHLELYFSGEVDPYFKAYATAAVSEDGAEMEEAVIQTTCLPAGFQLQAGKFFSHFGRLNQQHSHQWDFVDQPLIYEKTLGEDGLNDRGVQLSWLAPTPFHLVAGVEAFQGDNELLFSHIGGDVLPDKDGPRLWVGWIKFSPNLPQKHGVQAGLFGGRGVHQEEHDGDSDGTNDQWLDGHGEFLGGDFVYKYDCNSAYGLGDFTLQGEYFWRKKDLSVYLDNLNPAFEGRDSIDKQDGYYIQALYGFLPRWRAGLRWEEVGLTNESEFPDGTSESYDASSRISGMLDFTPTEFSRIRIQANRGQYELADGPEDLWQIYVQLMISLGTHGAHKF